MTRICILLALLAGLSLLVNAGPCDSRISFGQIPGPKFVGAEERLFFSIKASGATNIRLSAPGLPENAIFKDMGNGNGNFYFAPEVSQIEASPYQVVFEAEAGGQRTTAEVEISVSPELGQKKLLTELRLGLDFQDVIIEGSNLFAATGYGLSIFDISNPADPNELGHLATPGEAQALAYDSGYIFIADGERGLCIVNVKNIRNPLLVGRWEGDVGELHRIRGVAAANNYAYVADELFGLRVIDVKNPAAPREVSNFRTDGYAWKVRLRASQAYILTQAFVKGFQIIDVSDPETPREIGLYEGSDRDAYQPYDLRLAGNYAYIAAYAAGIDIVAITDPANPRSMGEFPTADKAYGLFVRDNRLFAALSFAGIDAYDLSDPVNPQFLAALDTPDFALEVSANSAAIFVADGFGGLQTMKLSNNDQEILPLGSFDEDGTAILSLASAPDSSLLALGQTKAGVKIFDVANPAQPERLGQVALDGDAFDLARQGNYLYLANGRQGCAVIDLANPRRPKLAAEVGSNGFAEEIALADGIGAIPLGLDGLLLLDIDNPDLTRKSGNYNPVNPLAAITGVSLNGNIAYLADMLGGVTVLDLSQRGRPQTVWQGDFKTSFEHIVYQAGYAYLLDSDGGFWILEDQGNRQGLTMRSRIDLMGLGSSLAIQGQMAYAAMWSGGVRIIDISQPASPREIGYLETPGTAMNIAVSPEHIFLADVNGAFIYQRP
jgi:hypothetical protein